MSAPTVTVIQDWPAAMGIELAAKYIDVSDSQFKILMRTYPDKLRPFNLLPGGDSRWSRSTLDAYLKFREAVGRESKSA